MTAFPNWSHRSRCCNNKSDRWRDLPSPPTLLQVIQPYQLHHLTQTQLDRRLLGQEECHLSLLLSRQDDLPCPFHPHPNDWTLVTASPNWSHRSRCCSNKSDRWRDLPSPPNHFEIIQPYQLRQIDLDPLLLLQSKFRLSLLLL